VFNRRLLANLRQDFRRLAQRVDLLMPQATAVVARYRGHGLLVVVGHRSPELEWLRLTKGVDPTALARVWSNYEPGARILRSAQFLRSATVKRSRKGLVLRNGGASDHELPRELLADN
jgi:hypothetical protein